jgi:hypothetical protein
MPMLLHADVTACITLSLQIMCTAAHLPCRITSRGTFAVITSRQQQASQAGRQPSGHALPRVMLLLSMQLLRPGWKSFISAAVRNSPKLAQERPCREEDGERQMHQKDGT